MHKLLRAGKVNLKKIFRINLIIMTISVIGRCCPLSTVFMYTDVPYDFNLVSVAHSTSCSRLSVRRWAVQFPFPVQKVFIKERCRMCAAPFGLYCVDFFNYLLYYFYTVSCLVCKQFYFYPSNIFEYPQSISIVHNICTVYAQGGVSTIISVGFFFFIIVLPFENVFLFLCQLW